MSEAPPLSGRTRVRTLKVEDLLEKVREGAIRIPPFQRPPRWKTRHVVELYDSIVRGYPIGSLLFAEREAPAAVVDFGALTTEAPARHDAWFVVDGQQRLRALASALLHPEETPRGDIHAIWYDLVAKEFFRLTRATPPDTAIPLRALGRSSDTLRWLRRWPLDIDREDLTDHAIEVGEKIREFAVSCAVVTGESDAPLREIFRRLNNVGVAMKVHEVFSALYAHQDAASLKQATVRLTETGFGALSQDLFYQCMLSVEGLESGTRPEDQAFSPSTTPVAVGRTESALRAACEFFVTDVGIPHVKLLPYTLPLRIAARFFACHPKPSQRARTLLRRWVWRGIVEGVFNHWSLSQVRAMQSRAASEDAETAARALLDDLPPVEVRIDPLHEPWNARSVPSLLVALALMHRAPRDPRDGVALTIDAVQMMLPSELEDGGEEETPSERGADTKALSEIVLDVAGRSVQQKASVASRVVVRDAGALGALPTASNEVLEDHLISPEAALALRDALHGPPEGRATALRLFEALRAQPLQSYVEDFLTERCDLGASDRVSIAAIRGSVARALGGT
jgi:hypothetical protein